MTSYNIFSLVSEQPDGFVSCIRQEGETITAQIGEDEGVPGFEIEITLPETPLEVPVKVTRFNSN